MQAAGGRGGGPAPVIGVSIQDFPTVPATVERAKIAEKLGLESIWLATMPNSRDAGATLAAFANATERIALGTSILPIYTRHPTFMAQMAGTVDELSEGRFTLGLGMGQRLFAEWMLGVKLGAPLQAMREYLTIVKALLTDGEVHFTGEQFSGHAWYAGPRREHIPVVVGALQARMLELSGELADGALLWFCSPEYLRDHALPSLRAGLARSDRGLEGFPVVAMVPVIVTKDRRRDQDSFRQYVASYARFPNYRRMFEASGFAASLREGKVSDEMVTSLAAIGGKDDIQELLHRYGEAGATGVLVAHMADQDQDQFARTLEAALECSGSRS
jgi:F420-dependent oxidoreductase-like protein